MKLLSISLPLAVIMPRKTAPDRVFTLNLNIYRNTHHMTLNNAKTAWKSIVQSALCKGWFTVPMPAGPFRFEYTVYPATKRAFDLGNVLPIIQKFTDDALIELGLIQDDSFKHISEISYRIGEQDKENPRAELAVFALT